MSKDGFISNNFTRYPSQVSSQCGSKTTTCAAKKHKNGTVLIFQEFSPIFVDQRASSGLWKVFIMIWSNIVSFLFENN